MSVSVLKAATDDIRSEELRKAVFAAYSRLGFPRSEFELLILYNIDVLYIQRINLAEMETIRVRCRNTADRSIPVLVES